MSYCVYKIVCDDLPDFVYVGSTKAFRSRKSQHKQGCNNENNKSYNSKLYTTIRENGGWDEWRMICVEEFNETIDSKRKAEAKEEEWRIKLKANMNMKKCYITKEEEQERDRLHKKEYYLDNKEKILNKTKENMTEEKYENKLKREKQRYYDNREKILNKAKERYYENKK